jgi:hypothetical protein
VVSALPTVPFPEIGEIGDGKAEKPCPGGLFGDHGNARLHSQLLDDFDSMDCCTQWQVCVEPICDRLGIKTLSTRRCGDDRLSIARHGRGSEACPLRNTVIFTSNSL